MDHYSFWWHYESPDCYNSTSEPTYYVTNSAVIIANNSNSDFALLSLIEDPRRNPNITTYYLGWDNSGNAGNSGVCIHHPNGDVKKISAYNAPISTDYLVNTTNNTATHWRVIWNATATNHGTTEGGSSGSPLLNEAHRIIGQLHGGYASCSQKNLPDWYGKFSSSWTGNGATDNRRKLQPWLDPLNTGKTTIDGTADLSTLDLYIKDRLEDIGDEQNPYDWQAERDKSPDIWVRNQNDGFVNQTHQEPEYNSGNPVYVYVKVRNKSSVAATGNERLSLYWTKAASWTSWPKNWDGSQPTIGNKIATVNLGNLAAGKDTIIEFIWQILDPYIYQNWATCLLARIEGSLIDTITIYPGRIDDDVYFNNNIAMRNVTITDVSSNSSYPGLEGDIFYPHGRFLYVGNASDEPQNFNFIFAQPMNENATSIVQNAEIKVIFDNEGWEIFADRLAENPQVHILKEKEVLMLTNNITLNNVHFPANTRVPIYVGFSFLAQNGTDFAHFQYDVIQKMGSDNSPLGGVYFNINRCSRPIFHANAGPDMDFYMGEQLNIQAVSIGEPALYCWYDENRNLLHQGENFSVMPDHTQTYTLEVTTLSDGFKDYDKMTVNLRNFYIESVYPTPANNQLTVKYKAENANSAAIVISNALSRVENRKTLNANQKQVVFNVSNYPAGTYTISLECNGKIVDTKTITIY